MNQIEVTQAGGNVTILDEKSYMKSNFIGNFPPNPEEMDQSESIRTRPT